MRLAVVLQFVATAIFALILLVFGGATAGLSGLLGGLCAAIPNAVFAARLALNKGRSAESYPVVFFLGEIIKVGLIILLFGAVIAWEGEKSWLALIGGLIVALKVPLFAMWFGGSRAPLDLSTLPDRSEQKKRQQQEDWEHTDWKRQDCSTNVVQ